MDGPRLYQDLAAWWPLLSAPEGYAEEAAFYYRLLAEASTIPLREVLELGSGGGNNASHLKAHFRMTLTDISAGMLEVSRVLNPECEHIQGDMRTVRLGRQFDAVFVHDAVCYMTTEADVRQAIATAFVHCKPGGAVVFCPDHTRENFRPSTRAGGRDGPDGRLDTARWRMAFLCTRTRGRAVATARTVGAYAISCGRGTRNRATRPMSPTLSICCESLRGSSGPSMTAI